MNIPTMIDGLLYASLVGSLVLHMTASVYESRIENRYARKLISLDPLRLASEKFEQYKNSRNI